VADVDPSRCPLCGKSNACAMAAGSGSCGTCWCAKVTVCQDALARVPAAAKDRACLCADCARGATVAPPQQAAPMRR